MPNLSLEESFWSHKSALILYKQVTIDMLRGNQGEGDPAAASNLGGASGVDVQVDGLLGVVVLEVEELGQHELRDRRHEAHPQVHDPVLVQERRQIRRRLLPRGPPQERHHLQATAETPF